MGGGEGEAAKVDVEEGEALKQWMGRDAQVGWNWGFSSCTHRWKALAERKNFCQRNSIGIVASWLEMVGELTTKVFEKLRHGGSIWFWVVVHWLPRLPSAFLM